MNRWKHIREDRNGFTLVEVLAVLVIIAILAAVAIPTMSGFISDARKKSYTSQARNVYVAAQAAALDDNGVTNFHFEIAADLLGEEEMELLAKMRPGLVQLEIGVQTTNTQTLEAIRRKTDLQEIQRITARINQGRNVHQHLDLIAGLPYEGMDSFRRSFNDVYAMEPEQLQLGFLKVLKGSYMEEMASAYGLTYSSIPPYEVLSTRWLSYDGILELKEVEDMVEVYYNSRQFTCTLKAFEKAFTSPYDMFYFMGEYYRNRGLAGISHNRIARYEILFDIIKERLILFGGQTYDVIGHADNAAMYADDMSRPH